VAIVLAPERGAFEVFFKHGSGTQRGERVKKCLHGSMRSGLLIFTSCSLYERETFYEFETLIHSPWVFHAWGSPKIFLVVSSPCVTWWWHDWVCVCVCVWKWHVIWQREAVSPFRTPVMVMTYFWKTLNFFPYFWSKAGYHIEVIGCHRRKNKTVMRMKTWQSIYN
jgi:hypothetical protein